MNVSATRVLFLNFFLSESFNVGKKRLKWRDGVGPVSGRGSRSCPLSTLGCFVSQRRRLPKGKRELFVRARRDSSQPAAIMCAALSIMSTEVPISLDFLRSVNADWIETTIPATEERPITRTRYLIRARFDGWFHCPSDVCKKLARTIGISDCPTAIPRFCYRGRYDSSAGAFIPQPINLDAFRKDRRYRHGTTSHWAEIDEEFLDPQPGDELSIFTVFQNVLTPDAYLCTHPFVEVTMLVTVPALERNSRVVCMRGDYEPPSVLPVLFERVVAVRAIPHETIQNDDAMHLMHCALGPHPEDVVFRKLSEQLMSRRDFIPWYCSGDKFRNRRHAAGVSKQWIYWTLGAGADMTRCPNYGLMRLLYGNQLVDRMENHQQIMVLMYLTVVFPECVVSVDSVRVTLYMLARVFMHGDLENLNTCEPRVDQEAWFSDRARVSSQSAGPTASGFYAFADHVWLSGLLRYFELNRGLDVKRFSAAVLELPAFAPMVAQVHTVRDRLHCFMTARELTCATLLDIEPQQLWGRVTGPLGPTVLGRANATSEETRLYEFYGALASGYRRASSRAIAVPEADADHMVLNQVVPAMVFCDYTDSPPAGCQFAIGPASQWERMRLAMLFVHNVSLCAIRCLHYQSQIIGVQNTVCNQGHPFVIVAPNAALAHQASLQWIGSIAMTPGEFCNKLATGTTNSCQALLRPNGAKYGALVLLHAELLGIEQWLVILETMVAARVRLGADPTRDPAVVIPVYQSFFERPQVTTAQCGQANAYGTDNVAVQLTHTHEVSNEIFLDRPDRVIDPITLRPEFPSEAKAIPFEAARLYHDLASETEEDATTEVAIRVRLYGFLSCLVRHMCKHDSDDDTLRATSASLRALYGVQDTLRLPRLYVHTGTRNLTDQRAMREHTFVHGDHLMVGETGEMLSLAVVRGSTMELAMPPQGALKATLSRVVRDRAYLKELLCDTSVPTNDDQERASDDEATETIAADGNGVDDAIEVIHNDTVSMDGFMRTSADDGAGVDTDTVADVHKPHVSADDVVFRNHRLQLLASRENVARGDLIRLNSMRNRLMVTSGVAFLCACARPAMYTSCTNVMYDTKSPWFFHTTRTHTLRPTLCTIDQFNRRDQPVVEEFDQAELFHQHSCPTESIADLRVPHVTRDPCFSLDAPKREFVNISSERHSIFMATQAFPVRAASYVGPAPKAVAIHLAPNTSIATFLGACAIARDFVQVIYSPDVRASVATDAKTKKAEARAEGMLYVDRGGLDPGHQEARDYITELREAFLCSRQKFRDTIDDVATHIIDRLVLKAQSTIPDDGIWLPRMVELVKEHASESEG